MEPRQRRYLWLMGVCIALIVLAWWWVRLWSVPLAVAMSLVAMVIPPAAAIVGNAGWESRVDRLRRREEHERGRSRLEQDRERRRRHDDGG